MKKVIRTIIECMAIMMGVWFIIHRHVISACLTGSPMPEAPEWHKKCFGGFKKD